MLTKICGITTVEAGREAAFAGADFIGFVFAESKRRVTKEQAKEISEKLPPNVKKVGVFVDEELGTIQEIASIVGLDYIQLHGEESPGFCQKVGYPVIKAFHIHERGDLMKLVNYQCDYFLLDSPAGKYRGGNGEVFNWSLAKDLPYLTGKILVAGGLHAGNVREAISEVNPAGVDVSSGVETDGVKDKEKIRAFIHEVKKER
ncbi:N-(5'-phosphoribosyl)anthranilate isomerase [Paraliobacillus quinghaiensis]|uniref:N-(5'-phosphoribosyl)anthranilate isomerase n=1 Tax=Paraliobacillus quinghaiensis TaxID=470815 RepID=A0A917WUF8_9BACI|nr:phosphoribosylanthranilate isomerase [Paraliobacillus quinghaiensis]GGM33356.1 N-(5'-phosphoribosyl)anthranilate isomerase [Paraliobacillus quinghaiensis]